MAIVKFPLFTSSSASDDPTELGSSSSESSSSSSESSSSSFSQDFCDVHTITQFTEASGPRYRKIALNGLPKPDGKPQSNEETDKESEETYVDALTLALRHDTSDIHIPVIGDELPFAIRRSYISEVFSTHPGVPFIDMPDRPFGTCWTSGFTANIKLTYRALSVPTSDCPTDRPDPDYTFVTDESGSVFRFVLIWHKDESTTPPNASPYFLPVPSNISEQDNFLAVLKIVNPEDPFLLWNYTFSKKYGTVLHFSSANISFIYDMNLEDPGTDLLGFYYAHLTKIVDRYGLEMTCNYASGANTLIPSSISLQDGRSIQITSDGKRISKIVDPRGTETSYNYETVVVVVPPTTIALTRLVSVVRSEGQTIHYAYDTEIQFDNTPQPPSATKYYNFLHCNLSSIQDGKLNTYNIAFRLDDSQMSLSDASGVGQWYKEPGHPRRVSSVTLPIAGVPVLFEKLGDPLRVVYDFFGVPHVMGIRQIKVTDAVGEVRRYTFSNEDLINAQGIDELFFGKPQTNRKYFLLIRWSKMTLLHPTGVEEVFTFNTRAAMALESVKDYSGNTTHFLYNNAYDVGNMFPWMSAVLRRHGFFYGFYGDPTAQIDAAGKTKIFEYANLLPKLQQIMKRITDEELRVTEYTIDSTNGLRLTETIREKTGEISRYTLFSYTHPTYKAFMTEKRVVDGTTTGDLITTYTPDVHGYLGTESIGGLTPTVNTYDPNGNKITVQDPNNHITHFDYDGLNRLTVVTYPNATTRHIGYDLASNKTSEIDENVHKTIFDYDKMNRLNWTQRVMGNIPDTSKDLIHRFDYNPVGSKISETDPRGYTTTYRYDSIQRMTLKIDALLRHWIYSYDGPNSGSSAFNVSDFKPTQTIDPRLYRINFTYDVLYRNTYKSIEYLPNVFAGTTYIYDKVGNLTQVEDPLLKSTITSYDAQNRVTKVLYMDGKFILKGYTPAGLLTTETDESNSITTYQYDAAGRRHKIFQPDPVTGLKTADSPITIMGYDDVGNNTAMINPRNYQWDYVYDVRNRKTEEHQPPVANYEVAGHPIQRPVIYTGYDFVGNVNSRTDARGKITQTAFDNANRAWKITFPAVPVYGQSSPVIAKVETVYDKNGNVLEVLDEEGHVTVNIYDPLNQLKSTKTSPVTGNPGQDILVQYDYDEVGNRILMFDGRNLKTRFEYDGMHRLTVTHYDDGTALVATVSFVYDGVNKTSRQDATNRVTRYEYDLRNRLLKVKYI